MISKVLQKSTWSIFQSNSSDSTCFPNRLTGNTNVTSSIQNEWRVKKSSVRRRCRVIHLAGEFAFFVLSSVSSLGRLIRGDSCTDSVLSAGGLAFLPLGGSSAIGTMYCLDQCSNWAYGLNCLSVPERFLRRSHLVPLSWLLHVSWWSQCSGATRYQRSWTRWSKCVVLVLLRVIIRCYPLGYRCCKIWCAGLGGARLAWYLVPLSLQSQADKVFKLPEGCATLSPEGRLHSHVLPIVRRFRSAPSVSLLPSCSWWRALAQIYSVLVRPQAWPSVRGAMDLTRTSSFHILTMIMVMTRTLLMCLMILPFTIVPVPVMISTLSLSYVVHPMLWCRRMPIQSPTWCSRI